MMRLLPQQSTLKLDNPDGETNSPEVHPGKPQFAGNAPSISHPPVMRILLALLAVTLHGHALTFGDFTYTDNGTSITITDYPTTATGEVVIPATISGKPVTAIGGSAFYLCAGVTQVTIPSSVTSIGYRAFQNCTSLAGVTMGSSVTSIGERAFLGCRSLATVSIPDSVTHIGEYAFLSCISLTSVSIGNSVVSIGPSAFSGCSSLAGIAIPDSTTSIGTGAFDGCTSLSGIMIGRSVSSLGNSAFLNCTALLSIDVESANASYASIGGVLYNKDISLLIAYPLARVGSFTIPGSVAGIGAYAFHSSTGLTQVTIPNSVTTIGLRAFYGCGALTGLNIPNSVTGIGDFAFADCTSLASATLGNSLTSIPQGMFYRCGLLAEIIIPDTATTIGGSAFFRCSSLASVSLGSAVASIGNQAFYSCPALTQIVIPGSVVSIGTYSFAYCSALNSVIIGNSLGSIGFHAFYICSALQSFDVDPSNSHYTSIGGVLYNKDTSLLIAYPLGKIGGFEIPGFVTSIDAYAFHRSSRITQVTIPASVTSIGTQAFSYSTNLEAITVDETSPAFTSIDGVLYDKALTTVIQCPNAYIGSHTIPETVTAIGSGAFVGCRGLTEIHIPDGITTIAPVAFASCYSLASVRLPVNLTSIGISAFENCVSLTDVVIPNSVTEIGYSAFQSCSSLANVTLPAVVTSYGDRVFSDCPELTQLTIPSGVTSLRRKDFTFCTELTSLTLPASVNGFDSIAIVNCPKLAEINIDPTNPNLTNVDGVIYTKDMSALVRCPPAYGGTINIPASVTTIRNGAFDGCGAIAGITVDPANPNFSSTDGVLYNKDQTTLVFCPAGFTGSYPLPLSVTAIAAGALSQCNGITSFITDPAHTSFSSMNGSLFDKAQATLIRCPPGISGGIVIPPTTTAINIDAFERCADASSITVAAGNPSYASLGGVLYSADLTQLIRCPAGFTGNHEVAAPVTTIADYAFDGCKSLTAVTLPASLTTVGSSAFMSCHSLESVTVPASVETLSWWCFFDCPELADITFLGDAPDLLGVPSLHSVSSPNPTIFYFGDAAGFTTINWYGYPVANMGAGTPVKRWLISEGLPHDQDTGADPNGDGVALLAAYALNLPHSENLAARMPQAVRTADGLEMEFYGAAEGVTYRAQCSDNLIDWFSTGVELTTPDIDGLRTATLPFDESCRFMRLVFEAAP